jgi:glycosyltransferase involved in cell wall biosynthesis
MNRPLKVCFIGGYRPFPLRGLRGGGPNAVSAPLIDAFAKMNLNTIQIVVISTPFKEIGVPLAAPKSFSLSKNVEVHYIPILNPFVVLKRLAQCDLVHIFALEPQNIIICLFSKILRKKVVVTSHGYPPLEGLMKPKGLRFKIYNLLTRKIIEHSDAVTTVSHILQRILVHALQIPLSYLNRFTVIHNGTDITPRWQAKRGNSLEVISVLGRNYLNKGLPVILEALERLHPSVKRKISVTLMGEIPESLLSKTHRDVTITVLKKVPHKKLAQLYAKAHIILQPSFFETFNLPALEAAGRGCIPIITTRMGVAEIFENGKEAFIIKPGDSNCIAELLTCLASYDNLRKEMSRRAYERSLNYTYDKVAERYLSLYLSTLKENNKYGIVKIVTGFSALVIV